MLFLVCDVLSGGFCIGLMPLFLGFLGRCCLFFVCFGALWLLVCSWLFVGLWPFGSESQAFIMELSSLRLDLCASGGLSPSYLEVHRGRLSLVCWFA